MAKRQNRKWSLVIQRDEFGGEDVLAKFRANGDAYAYAESIARRYIECKYNAGIRDIVHVRTDNLKSYFNVASAREVS